MSEDNDGEMDFIRQLEARGVVWGFEDEDGYFHPIPKLPLVRAGYRKPPFTVTIHNRVKRTIVAKTIAIPSGEGHVTLSLPPEPGT